MGHSAFHNAAKTNILHFTTFLPKIAKLFHKLMMLRFQTPVCGSFPYGREAFSSLIVHCTHYYAVEFLFLYARPGSLQGTDYTRLNGNSGDKIIYNALLHNH